MHRKLSFIIIVLTIFLGFTVMTCLELLDSTTRSNGNRLNTPATTNPSTNIRPAPDK